MYGKHDTTTRYNNTLCSFAARARSSAMRVMRFNAMVIDDASDARDARDATGRAGQIGVNAVYTDLYTVRFHQYKCFIKIRFLVLKSFSCLVLIFKIRNLVFLDYFLTFLLYFLS